MFIQSILSCVLFGLCCSSFAFFFFKQKTAYDIMPSLVGSEMCIRDRLYLFQRLTEKGNKKNMSEGKVFLVGAGPGDPGRLTRKAERIIKSADIVLYDTLVDDRVIALVPKKVELIDVGKDPNHHKVPQHKINDLLVKYAKKGKTVVRLKGGDPYVFGRGGEEAEELVAHGIDVEIVPGISSAVAVPAYAG